MRRVAPIDAALIDYGDQQSEQNEFNAEPATETGTHTGAKCQGNDESRYSRLSTQGADGPDHYFHQGIDQSYNADNSHTHQCLHVSGVNATDGAPYGSQSHESSSGTVTPSGPWVVAPRLEGDLPPAYASRKGDKLVLAVAGKDVKQCAAVLIYDPCHGRNNETDEKV